MVTVETYTTNVYWTTVRFRVFAPKRNVHRQLQVQMEKDVSSSIRWKWIMNSCP